MKVHGKGNLHLTFLETYSRFPTHTNSHHYTYTHLPSQRSAMTHEARDQKLLTARHRLRLFCCTYAQTHTRHRDQKIRYAAFCRHSCRNRRHWHTLLVILTDSHFHEVPVTRDSASQLRRKANQVNPDCQEIRYRK